ncbi:MAG: DUF882 domain-containing protein [Firmicutes bacterium]|nr:DUF882 domain-containing protein [Bacillota bacterium]
MNDFQLSKNFNLKEFQSNSDNPVVMLDPKLVDLLQRFRDKLNKPCYVNSGYRTPEYNEAIGGYEKSKHLLGQAADISKNNLDKTDDELIQIAVECGFKGIGIYDTHIHLDCGYYAYPNEYGYYFWDYRTKSEE